MPRLSKCIFQLRDAFADKCKIHNFNVASERISKDSLYYQELFSQNKYQHCLSLFLNSFSCKTKNLRFPSNTKHSNRSLIIIVRYRRFCVLKFYTCCNVRQRHLKIVSISYLHQSQIKAQNKKLNNKWNIQLLVFRDEFQANSNFYTKKINLYIYLHLYTQKVINCNINIDSYIIHFSKIYFLKPWLLQKKLILLLLIKTIVLCKIYVSI